MEVSTWAPNTPEYAKFFKVVSEGNVADLDKAFISGPDFNINAGCRTRDYYGKAALHIATVNGKFEMIKFLLDNGADVNLYCWDQVAFFTPLHYAASWSTCNTDIIALLLDRGADMYAKGDYCEGTALELVLYRKKEVKERHIEIIKLFLDRGMDINAETVETGDPVVGLQGYNTLR
jgi:ankyrin repeat protein